MANSWALFGLCLSSLIVVAISWRLWPAWHIRRWRQQLNLDNHERVFQQLYAPVDGFSLSKAAREHEDDLSYVYGEIEFEPFIALLSLAKPEAGTRFIDLGSGTGKAVLAAMMVFRMQEARGIELFTNLHQTACRLRDQLITQATYQDLQARIQFTQGDFMQIPLDQADLIFINATAFFGQLWLDLGQKLDQLTACQTIITTSKPLNCAHYIQTRQTRVEMSWGAVDAFIHQRCP